VEWRPSPEHTNVRSLLDATPTSGSVTLERRGPILIVAIENRERRNAIDAAVADALAAAWRTLDREDELRAGVITGAGGTFCSGLDLVVFAAGGRIDDRFLRQPPRKPLVAAVEGYALAGGLELALCADLIVAAESAQLGLPEVKHGLVASGGGVMRLATRIPYHLALELALTGASIGAVRAAELGLVNSVAADGHALDAALELAQTVAANAPLAVEASKRLAREAPMEWTRQRSIAEPVLASADALEGARAFTERRRPRFSGR